MRTIETAAAALLLLGASAAAAGPAAEPAAVKPWSAMTTGELIAAAPREAWRPLPADRLMVMDFKPTADAAPVRVVVLLAPDFAPRHVEALSTLAARGFFDDAAIVRSQENYVAQWGDGAAATRAGLPGGAMAAEFDAPLPADFRPFRLVDGDVHAPRVGVWRGWPVAWDPRARRMWLPHCNAMVGAGRDEAPDSGGPAELYAVNGHAPRALDRNVTLIGRVVVGMEHLSTLPRGTEALGFYGPAQHRPAIVRARLASALPDAERPRLQALATDHPIFAELVESRRNRRDTWTVRKAGRIDVCNVPLPVRAAP